MIEGSDPLQGLKMNSPQREFIFEKYKKNIVKMIKNSNLEKLGIVDSNKIYKLYRSQEKSISKKKIKKYLKIFQVMKFGNLFLLSFF